MHHGVMRSEAKSAIAEWQNWSGSLQCQPRKIAHPANRDELAQIIRQAQTVRPVGAGHSWTALVSTEDVIVDLSAFNSIGPVHGARVWLGAGARLHALSAGLSEDGLAFRNLGDIDVQSLAGATSTATHGTGRTLPCLSAEITAVKLLTAEGETLTINDQENADLLPAIRVGLGALGILTDIEMQLVPAYSLHRKVWFAPVGEIIADAEILWNRHRNFEFFYIPFSGQCMAIAHDVTEAPATVRAADESDQAVMQLKAARDFAGWFPWLRRRILSAAISASPEETVIGPSWQLLASQRNVLFNEMEYHIDAARGLACFDEITRLIERDHRDVFFPVEVRRTAADNAFMSPFSLGEKISIAVHCYYKDAYKEVFDAVERVFQKYGGRPHWGKMHSLTARHLPALYPNFERFARLRRELDPQGKFLNPYLSALLGV